MFEKKPGPRHYLLVRYLSAGFLFVAWANVALANGALPGRTVAWFFQPPGPNLVLPQGRAQRLADEVRPPAPPSPSALAPWNGLGFFSLPKFAVPLPRPETPVIRVAKLQSPLVLRSEPNPGGGTLSLARELGVSVRRIVIDAGHGGHDEGAVGRTGLAEKDVVLDVSLRLGVLARQRMGLDVVLTRSDDTFVALRRRTAIANEQEADLFVSVHANSSRTQTAQGVETYFLNFSGNVGAVDVAARENAGSRLSMGQLRGVVQAIAMNDKAAESKLLARQIQESVTGIRRMADRGVKQAPFVVLTGAEMPSVLVEIGFLSNPSDEARLATPAGRQRIAESICAGLEAYLGTFGAAD